MTFSVPSPSSRPLLDFAGVNLCAVVFSLRPPYLLRCEPSGKAHKHKQSGTKVCTGDSNLGPNSVKQILDARILDPNSWVELFDSVFPAKEAP